MGQSSFHPRLNMDSGQGNSKVCVSLALTCMPQGQEAHYCPVAILVTLHGNLGLAAHQAEVWLLSSTLPTSGPQT